jgi:hypothetical protein
MERFLVVFSSAGTPDATPAALRNLSPRMPFLGRRIALRLRFALMLADDESMGS